jgi:hypothetical protein
VGFNGTDKGIINGNVIGGDLAKPMKQRIVLVCLDEKRRKISASFASFPVYLNKIQEHLFESSRVVYKLTIHSLEVLIAKSCFLGVGRDMEAAQRPRKPLDDNELLLFELTLNPRP